MEEEGMGARSPISCYSTIRNTVDKYPGKLAWVDHMQRKWTYEQYFADVTTSAKALIELGLEQHRSVAVLGANSPEWFSCAVGAVMAGGLVTGVYTTNMMALSVGRTSRLLVAVLEMKSCELVSRSRLSTNQQLYVTPRAPPQILKGFFSLRTT